MIPLFGKNTSKFATAGVALTLGALVLSGCGASGAETNSSSTSASSSASNSAENTAATIAGTTTAAEDFMATLSDSEKETLLYERLHRRNQIHRLV